MTASSRDEFTSPEFEAALESKAYCPSGIELVAVLGPELAETLCEKLGGLNTAIGRPSAKFVDAIGHEAALKLKRYVGRTNIFIPKRLTSRQERWNTVIELHETGMTKAQIALTVDLSERRVYAILQRWRRARKAAAA